MTQPARRPGRPSLLSKLGPHYEPAPPLAPPSQAVLLVEIADVLHAAGEAIRLLADSVRTVPAPVAPPADDWLSLSEAARVTRLGKSTLARWIATGHLPAMRDADGQPYQPYRVRRSALAGLGERVP